MRKSLSSVILSAEIGSGAGENVNGGIGVLVIPSLGMERRRHRGEGEKPKRDAECAGKRVCPKRSRQMPEMRGDARNY